MQVLSKKDKKMAFLDGNSCSHSCSDRIRKPAAYVDPKYLAEQQQKAAATEAWTGLGISLFLGLTGRVIQGVKSGEISFGSGADVEGLTEDEIKEQITKTLNEFKCGTISEAETLLASRGKYEQAEADKSTAETYLLECNSKKIVNDKIISSSTKNIEQWSADKGVIEGKNKELVQELILARQVLPIGNDENTRIAEIEAEIKRNTLEIDRLEKAIKAAEESKRKAEAENKLLEAKIPNTEIKIKGLDEIIAQGKDIDFDKLETAVNNLHKYEKQLKKLEADTTLANYQHEDSENITDILDKLKRAKANGNDKNVKKYEEELKKALEDYAKGNSHTNATLNNLAKVYGVDIPQK